MHRVDDPRFRRQGYVAITVPGGSSGMSTNRIDDTIRVAEFPAEGFEAMTPAVAWLNAIRHKSGAPQPCADATGNGPGARKCVLGRGDIEEQWTGRGRRHESVEAEFDDLRMKRNIPELVCLHAARVWSDPDDPAFSLLNHVFLTELREFCYSRTSESGQDRDPALRRSELFPLALSPLVAERCLENPNSLIVGKPTFAHLPFLRQVLADIGGYIGGQAIFTNGLVQNSSD